MNAPTPRERALPLTYRRLCTLHTALMHAMEYTDDDCELRGEGDLIEDALRWVNNRLARIESRPAPEASR